MGNRNIIGPFFFQGNVDGEGYLQMINQQVVPAVWRMCCFGPNRDRLFQMLWWVQDGAPPHRRRVVSEQLRELFGEHVVALNPPVEWPPRSPDLQSFPKPARTPVIFNHNSVDTSFFKQYASPSPSPSPINVGLQIRIELHIKSEKIGCQH